MGSGGEDVVGVVVYDLFSIGTIGRDVRRRLRSSAFRALPDEG